MTTWRVDHDGYGQPILVRINDDNSETSGLATGSLRPAFDAWNALQQPPLVVAAIAIIKPSTPVLDYAQAFVNNLPLWAKLHKVVDDERHTFSLSPTPTAATILAKLKLQLKAVRAVIITAPQGIVDEFNRERILQGSTLPLVFTDADIDAVSTPNELRICLQVARAVASQGLAIAAVVSNQLD